MLCHQAKKSLSLRHISLFSRYMSRFRIIEHIVPAQHTRDRYAGAELGRENDLRLHVKQYIPRNNPTPRPADVTIIGAVANAYPKEIQEPLWDDLLLRLDSKGRNIRAIWVVDPVNTGHSGVLNEPILGPDPSWLDHGRDLLFLINQFQSDIPHPIIGIGHSMGASHLAHLALLHPRLLDALVIMDPVIQLVHGGQQWAQASTYRRDLWPSRQAAAEKLRSSRVLQAWDSRVLDKYIEYGLRELPTELYPDIPADSGSDTPVTLQTTKSQELFNYIRPIYHDDRMLLSPDDVYRDFHPVDIIPEATFARHESKWLYRRLPELRPSTLFIFGAKSEVSSAEAIEDKLAITGTAPGGSGGRVKGKVQSAVLDCGHLVPLEKPAEAAELCATFVHAELERWEADEKDRRQRWEQFSRKQRVEINDLWRKNVGPPPGRTTKRSEGETKL